MRVSFVNGLREDWINGNRKDVMERIGRMSPFNAARVAMMLTGDMDADDRKIFGKMLDNRTGHDECAECGLMFDATSDDATPVCSACRPPSPAPAERPRRTMEMGEPGHPYSCKGCGCYLGPNVPDGYCAQCYPGERALNGGAP